MYRSLWQNMIWGCVFAVIPGSLYAVDGVVLIDQAHAMAGNITPGDTPGFPVTISQPGSYRLSGNLTVPDADTTAIMITSDHVSLDLNGFSIIGPVVCPSEPAVCPAAGKGVGIQSGPDFFSSFGIHIFNGAVRGMGSLAISLIASASTVERVTADNNAGGGMVVDGSVFECTIFRNGGTFGVLAIVIKDSIVNQNTGDGIIVDASGGVATGNIASFNGGTGIRAPNATVARNTIVRNGSNGITATCPSSIAGNTVVSNSPGSIVTSAAGCVLTDNATRP